MVRNNNGPSFSNNESPSISYNNNNNNNEDTYVENNVEPFGNMTFNTDLVLKAIFWGAIFYLLCLPQVHKMTAKIVGNKVDGHLVHGIVYAVLYFVLSQFI
jgi:hypothetical protein